MLYRYETADGRVVYSNLPIDRLSVTVREMLAEGGVPIAVEIAARLPVIQ